MLKIYKITETFPKAELYGLVSQVRRAVISVVANIVEGSKRATVKDRTHFHTMADTSLEEVKYYLLLSYELGYISKEQGAELTENAREIGRMLNALTKAL